MAVKSINQSKNANVVNKNVLDDDNFVTDYGVNFADFREKDVVSGLRRSLLLDKRQFNDLPTGTIVLKEVKTSKMDNDSNSSGLNNIKYYQLIGVDQSTIDQIKEAKGLPESIRRRMIASVPRVYIRAEVRGGKARLGTEAFDFVAKYHLDTNPMNVALSNIDWGVTWQYADQYHDILGLVILNYADVKVKMPNGETN